MTGMKQTATARPRLSGCLRPLAIAAMHREAPSVAREPKTMSGMPYPPARFAMAQPAQRPQAVKGTKAGSMQSASDTRNCTRPKLIGASSKVKAA